MDKAIAFVKTLGPGRIAAMVGVAVFLIGFFAYVMMRASQPNYTTLYSDLTFEDSAAIIKQLDTQAVPYKLKNDGAIIMVPQDQSLKLRMKLAESGMPRGGSIGYEIFDKSSTLGATSFVQNINHIRALEGELVRSIRTIDRVQTARVHLVIPERKIFSREKQDPHASIVLKLRGALDSGQIKAIQHLVASAVSGLKPNNVAIVDERGKLLAAAYGEDIANSALVAEERKVALERRLRDEVESIVASVVGQGRARVQISAEFDMNKTTQTQDSYDPESRVLRSSQTRNETSKIVSSANNNGEVSNSTELPNANNRNEPVPAQPQRDETSKTDETANYEISRVTKTEVNEPGRLKRISVAVLVDGVYTKSADDKFEYTSRTKEELDQIASLVRSSVGFSEERGDNVEVINLKFADTPNPLEFADTSEKQLFDITFTKDDIMFAIELGVMAILSLAMILFIVRPMMKRALSPAEQVFNNASNIQQSTQQENKQAVAPVEMVTRVIQNADGTHQAISVAADSPEASMPDMNSVENNRTLAAIEIAKSMGQMQQVSLQKVGELVDNNPEEAVIIIRQWMAEADIEKAA